MHGSFQHCDRMWGGMDFKSFFHICQGIFAWCVHICACLYVYEHVCMGAPRYIWVSIHACVCTAPYPITSASPPLMSGIFLNFSSNLFFEARPLNQTQSSQIQLVLLARLLLGSPVELSLLELKSDVSCNPLPQHVHWMVLWIQTPVLTPVRQVPLNPVTRLKMVPETNSSQSWLHILTD